MVTVERRGRNLCSLKEKNMVNLFDTHTEFWVFLSMVMGLCTRLGAPASLQLHIGLANLLRPFARTYGFLVLLSIAMLDAAAGRIFGPDNWLRRRLAGSAERGICLARVGLLLS
jgi:hypothetical protein